uniref:Uncharacterized protein n=1 Tax=Arundo donax TaxID=35708 RepID=A0A0A9G8Q3_ARUDO
MQGQRCLPGALVASKEWVREAPLTRFGALLAPATLMEGGGGGWQAATKP